MDKEDNIRRTLYQLKIYEKSKEFEVIFNRAMKWIDNGLITDTNQKPLEKGLALENELGKVLEIERWIYGLQVLLPISRRIADAVIRLKNGIYVRIESKYVTPERVTPENLYRNTLEWGHIYQDKPYLFYEYTLLYVNQQFSNSLKKEDAHRFYHSKLIIVTKKNLSNWLTKLEGELGTHRRYGI